MRPRLRLVADNPPSNVPFSAPPPIANNTTSALAAQTFGETFFPYAPQFVSFGEVMPDPTREEFDAKLATVEARTETRFVELSGKIDRLSDSVTALASGVTNQLTDIRREVRSENIFTRWTVVIAVVTSLIGAVAALWGTQGNLLAAFTAGLTLRTETKEASPTLPPAQPKR